MNEQIRKEFEQWAKDKAHLDSFEVDGEKRYASLTATTMWQSWQAAHTRYAGSGLVRNDYISRLIAGVRKAMDQDPETIDARRELGDEVTIGRWVDASILCEVVEQDVLSAAPAQPKVPDEQPRSPSEKGQIWADGWNSCRQAMLSASQQGGER